MLKAVLITAALALCATAQELMTDAHPVLEAPNNNWNIPGTKALVKKFEGLYLTAYLCPAGVWTIGWGHTGPEVKKGMKITTAQAETYLTNDLQKFANCINKYIKVRLNDNQNGALVSFSFNVGCGAFSTSTLLKRLNAGENPNTVASQELPRWNKGGGKVLPGLVRRREEEVKFFKS